MNDKRGDRPSDGEKFGNRGHRLVQPTTRPSQRPAPQAPKPDKK